MKVENCLVGSIVTFTQALWASAPIAQHSDTQEHGHAAFCDVTEAEATPILDVSDFDASGSVDEADLALLQNQIDASEYTAFFDRNADRRLDETDGELVREDIGSRSAPRDQQLAMAYQHTKAFRDRETAIRQGYTPFTQVLHGHGAHWSQNPEGGGLGYSFAPGNPVGLNYASDGALWGIFYYIGPSGSREDGSVYPPRHTFRPFSQAPEGFEGDDDAWHWHAGTCFVGLDVNNPSLDPADYEFLERLSPSECAARAREASGGQIQEPSWVPQFHMLHVWLYELNPCGTFAGAHPELDIDAADPAESIVFPERHPEAPHPEYDFAGGTMCAWLSEAGTVPRYCSHGAGQ